MSKAFVDTTVLTNALLKPSDEGRGREALAAIQSFESAEAPTYALKELQLGPLRAYVWLHNALKSTNSIGGTIDRLHALSRSYQRNLHSTALEALREAIRAARTVLRSRSVEEQDRELADAYRLSVLGLVLRAWAKRGRVVAITFPISCYLQEGPTQDHKGMLHVGEACPRNSECALAAYLRSRIREVETVRDAIIALKSTRREDLRRTSAMKRFLKRPEQPLSEETCRHLGDAVFAILCPVDATVLTTNIRDHRPLAESLSKTVQSP